MCTQAGRGAWLSIGLKQVLTDTPPFGTLTGVGTPSIMETYRSEPATMRLH